MKRRAEELEEKYFDLVSLARKTEEDERTNDKVKAFVEYVRTKYPQEAEDLADEEEGDWSHGFNSGVLAAARYILNPEDPFPSLDT